jgi:hypothetical protein
MRWVLCGAFLGTIWACSSGLTDPVGGGLYALVAVDGAPLPFRVGTQVTVRGSLQLAQGRKFTLQQSDSSTTDTKLSELHVTGDWGITENALALTGGFGSGILYLGITYGAVDSVRLTMGAHQNLYARRNQ